jgi:hypothetical protein
LQNFFSGVPLAIFSKNAQILTVIFIGHRQLNNTYCGSAGLIGPTGLLGILGLLGLPVLLGLLKFGMLVQIGLAGQGA